MYRLICRNIQLERKVLEPELPLAKRRRVETDMIDVRIENFKFLSFSQCNKLHLSI